MKTNTLPTWLIIAHCFNMDGRAASQTITDRIPLLMANGINPVVLSAPTGSKDRRFPHYRCLSVAPSGILFEIRHIIRLKLQSRTLQRVLKTLLTLACLPFYILEKIFIHLDSQWSWFLGATLHGLLVVKKHRPSFVYSTAGPPSTHLVGYFLHKLCRLPWLAEIHDPLIYNEDSHWRQRYWFNRLIERLVSRHADTIIFFTEQARNQAAQRHPALKKTAVLRPGANPPDFNAVDYLKSDTLNLSHFGSLAPDRNITVILQALSVLFTTNPEYRAHFRLHIYGATLDAVSAAALKRYQMTDIVVQHGRLEYNPQTGKSGRQQIIEAMRQSDILLLLHGSGPSCHEYVPSKLYEYLLVQRPILGLASPGSELAGMLLATGHYAPDGDDYLAVKAIISLLIEQWRTTGLPDQHPVLSFTVQDATDQLIRIAEQITLHPDAS